LNILSVFPETENVHLTKDVGMLPYALHHYYNYDATLLTCDNDTYENAVSQVPGLNIYRMRCDKKKVISNVIQYIYKNRKNIDCVQVYHLQFRSLLWLTFFKIVKPSGKTFLKLDANEHILTYQFEGIKNKIKKYLLDRIDIVSVESKQLQNQLQEKWNRKIDLIHNGFQHIKSESVLFSDKKNEIIQVGRIGAPEKNNELTLNTFIKIAKDFPDWNLKFIGPVTDSFFEKLKFAMHTNSELKERISWTGAINNRAELMQGYANAKVYCCTSFREGFSIANVEALSQGCYIITSDIVSANDITNNGKFGIIYPRSDESKFEYALRSILNDSKKMEIQCPQSQQFAMDYFSWSAIANQVNQLLIK
jgi:glycosyltransferase involved in cell wall biosynthesis